MPVSAGASAEEFKAASYLVEAVYRQTPQGIVYLMSTAMSNSSGGKPKYFEMYEVHHCHAIDVLPWQYVPMELMQCKGLFGEVWPDIRNDIKYPTMAAYCDQHFKGEWYQHWVGYSAQHYTLDGKWHCLDLYWQKREFAFTNMWVWYCLLDQSEPSDYWQGRILYLNGFRDNGLAEAYPARARL